MIYYLICCGNAVYVYVNVWEREETDTATERAKMSWIHRGKVNATTAWQTCIYLYRYTCSQCTCTCTMYIQMCKYGSYIYTYIHTIFICSLSSLCIWSQPCTSSSSNIEYVLCILIEAFNNEHCVSNENLASGWAINYIIH